MVSILIAEGDNDDDDDQSILRAQRSVLEILQEIPQSLDPKNKGVSKGLRDKREKR